MKKILGVLALVLVMAGCGSKEETFKGKEYTLVNPENDVEVMLGFDAKENRFYGKVVNNFFGSYELEGNKIKFGQTGSTMMMGPREAMEAERNFLDILPEVTNIDLKKKEMVLTTSDKKYILFKEVEKKDKK